MKVVYMTSNQMIAVAKVNRDTDSTALELIYEYNSFKRLCRGQYDEFILFEDKCNDWGERSWIFRARRKGNRAI